MLLFKHIWNLCDVTLLINRVKNLERFVVVKQEKELFSRVNTYLFKFLLLSTWFNPIPTGGGGGGHNVPPPPVGFLLITFLFLIQLA